MTAASHPALGRWYPPQPGWACESADALADEAVFVPSAKANRAEDDGRLLSTMHRECSASQLIVLDLDATASGRRDVVFLVVPALGGIALTVARGHSAPR